MSEGLREHRGMSPRDLRELREKYARMLALRQLHTRGREEPDFDEPDPRPEMTALARRWPGALREIDELELSTIEARIEALDRELARRPEDDAALTSDDVEPWMLAQARFHHLLRGALASKRWLGRERSATPELRAQFLAAIADQRLAVEAESWADDLSSIARPPRGRLLVVVFARLERELGISERELRALVFGASA